MGRSGEPSRRSVLDAVAKIVSEQGLEGVRVRQIAAAADLSPGAVLYHFPKNQDLLFAVHEDTVQRYVAARTAAGDEATDPAEALLSVMRAGVPPWANERVIRLLYEMHGLARRGEAHAALLSDLWRDEHALYVRIISDGEKAGSFAPVHSADDIATQLLALEDGLVLHLVGGNAAFTGDLVVERFAQAASTALGCPELIELAASSATPRGAART